MSNTQNRRISGLDSLRGVAILAVLIYHAVSSTGDGIAQSWIAYVRSFLWTGVDLFFVLSGFLITRILLRTRDHPRFFTTFYARRSLRVFPLFYLFVVAALFLPRILATLQPESTILSSDAYQRLWQGQSWIWLYLHNFIQAQGPSQFPGMGHLWSLAVEEQFYLLWPWFVWRTNNRRLGCLLLFVLLGTCAGRLVASLSGYSPWAIMHLTFFRLDGLAIGSLIAVAHTHSTSTKILRAWRRPLFWLASVSILAIAWTRGTFDWIDPVVQQVGFIAFSIAAGCVVDAIVERDSLEDQREQGALSRHLAMWGKYSYAIYVLHMPVIHIVRHFAPDLGDGLVALVASLASLAVGMASWYAWESHWLKLKPSYSPVAV